MRPIIVLTVLTLALGGCSVARGAWDTANIFQGKGGKNNPKADTASRAAGETVKHLPGGLGGDTANASHTTETLQTDNPQ